VARESTVAAAQAKQELAGQTKKAASGARLPNVQPGSVGLPETRTAETGTTEPGTAKEAGVATSAESAATQTTEGGGNAVAREFESSPDSDTIVVTITGDDDNKAGLAASEAELALTEKGLVVIDRGAAEGKKLADVAAMNMVMSFTQTGTTDLQYLGRTSVQYTVAITMKIVDCGSGRTKAGPASATVQYTALTAQQVLGQAARRLAEELQGQLKPP
jgi:hypothetical protein